ncbi:ribosome biogenesis GTPase Der [bacterium]|jgi:ribosome-associated GTPase engA|nr:ribosome biogenesis GTPase Der [bacterium]
MQTVCLVGKPNVGKSSIFNRLIKENKSIIMDTPGVTRDRIYGRVNHNDKSFYLIDTGGISLGEDDFAKDILVQATLAIDEADLVLFVVDGNDDPDASDKKVAEILHKSSKKVIVVVNKIDNDKKKENLYNYYELGFSDLVAVSASHNIGFDGLLNTITSDLPEEVKEEDTSLKFCIIGRPNVGKSSLINAILNEERAIVSDVAGTTRDAVDTKFKYNHEDITVIDTAGMRKKGKIYESVEKYSLIRSLKAIDRSDVCVLVIDASTGIIEHDKHIASYALDAGKGIVICVNKWDTINNPDSDIRKWKEDIKNEFQFIPYAHTVFLSAKTKKRLSGLMPEVINAYNNNRKEVKTSLLNNIIMEAVSMHEPPSYKGKRLKIYFVSQTGTCPPKFTFSVNNKGLVHFSYERYLENQIRNNIDFDGTPIMLQFKNKSEK